MGQLKTDYRDFVVASGGTTGDVQLDDFPVNGLIVPTIDSATLKIQGSYDGSTFYDIYDSTGTQVLIWAAGTGNRCFATRDLADVLGYKYARVVLGTAQTAARTFRLIMKRPKVG